MGGLVAGGVGMRRCWWPGESDEFVQGWFAGLLAARPCVLMIVLLYVTISVPLQKS